MSERLEILDIALKYGWPVAKRYIERVAIGGNKTLQSAIEDVKRSCVEAEKKEKEKKDRKRSSSPSSSRYGYRPHHWAPPGPAYVPQPYPSYVQPFPGYGNPPSAGPQNHPPSSKTPCPERPHSGCFRCGDASHMIRACPKKNST